MPNVIILNTPITKDIITTTSQSFNYMDIGSMNIDIINRRLTIKVIFGNEKVTKEIRVYMYDAFGTILTDSEGEKRTEIKEIEELLVEKEEAVVLDGVEFNHYFSHNTDTIQANVSVLFPIIAEKLGIQGSYGQI